MRDNDSCCARSASDVSLSRRQFETPVHHFLIATYPKSWGWNTDKGASSDPPSYLVQKPPNLHFTKPEGND